MKEGDFQVLALQIDQNQRIRPFGALFRAPLDNNKKITSPLNGEKSDVEWDLEEWAILGSNQ